MTERKPADLSFESWVERQIREATEAGEFDDLPGKGKPIPGLHRPYDELWWIRRKLASEGVSAAELLPVPLKLRREIERLPETIRLLHTEKAVREAIGDLNERIATHLRTPSGPAVPVRPVDPEPLIERWKAGRSTPAAVSAHGEPPRRRRSIFRRRRDR
jgi:DnaJ-like protein